MSNMSSKKRSRKIKSDAIVNQFSIRDVWDVLVIVILLGVIVYFASYVRKYRFDLPAWPQIRYVNFDGAINNVDAESLKKITRIHIAGGFFRVSMKRLEQDIRKIPWVYNATAQRFWPNTITINIFEQKPIARWGENGLMNAYGEVFFPKSIELYASLPMLYGEESRAKQLASIFEESLNQLKKLGLQLHGLFEDDRQSKHLVLSNGMIIAIGDGDTNEKINRFTAAYKQFLFPYIAELKKVDLRYTNGLAVEWKNPQLAHNFNMEHNL